MRKFGYVKRYSKFGDQILEYGDSDEGMLYFGGIDEDDARILLHKLKELFDEAGIQFSLVFGTLLGAVRNGTVIPGDDDMDIYVWDEEKLRAHIVDFHNRGLKLCRCFPGKLYTFMVSPACRIDVYIYGELKGILSLPWRRSCISIAGTETPRKFFTGYQEIEFLGEKVLCPENPERLLEFWYGSDWRIPQNKKGTYRPRSAEIFHKFVPDRRSFLKRAGKILKFIFVKEYRNDILLRKEKTGSYSFQKQNYIAVND